MRTKPILCVDFDGVVHSYTTPWERADIIPDPPVPGAIAWLAQAAAHFVVVIYSSRSKSPAGIEAMAAYIAAHALHQLGPDHPMAVAVGDVLEFSASKPPAFLTIDDRAICFNGDWSALDPAELLKFKPWNKAPTPDQDVMVVDGMRYARGLFTALAFLPIGATFRIVERDDGVLTLERVIPSLRTGELEAGERA